MDHLIPMITFQDVFLAPLCLLVLYMIFRGVSRKYDDETRRFFHRAFFFKMFCAITFTIIQAYYYREGDSEMYFFATQDMHKAVMEDGHSLWKVLGTSKINQNHFLAPYFYYDRDKYPVFEFMRTASNFSVPRLALFPSIIFSKSYLCITMLFSFFALGGTIRLYKLFNHYFPEVSRGLLLATLFLPSVTFWSSGVLKDSICLGAIGFLLYGVFQIIERGRKLLWSFFWVAISAYMLINIKVYILLALAPGIIFWIFLLITRTVNDKTLKRIMGVLMIGVAGAFGLWMINYLTSTEIAASFKLESMLESNVQTRAIYSYKANESAEGAYFSVSTTNPILMFGNGIIASFFRPFLWEVKSPIVALSALESLAFTWLTLLVFIKAGVKSFFKIIFSHPITIMCFIFSIVFAGAVGSSTMNFGSLSRYKIPCLPFYMALLMIVMHKSQVPYPGWLNKILGIKSPQRTMYVKRYNTRVTGN